VTASVPLRARVRTCTCASVRPPRPQVLQALANLQPAVDEEGAVLQPLPRAHRGIADASCLPHIAQVMLTGASPPGRARGRARGARLCVARAAPRRPLTPPPLSSQHPVPHPRRRHCCAPQPHTHTHTHTRCHARHTRRARARVCGGRAADHGARAQRPRAGQPVPQRRVPVWAGLLRQQPRGAGGAVQGGAPGAGLQVRARACGGGQRQHRVCLHTS
jgi:hypothetical protein